MKEIEFYDEDNNKWKIIIDRDVVISVYSSCAPFTYILGDFAEIKKATS